MTFYQSQYQFNTNFEQGRMQAAEDALQKDKKADERKTRLLYFLNMGVVTSMQGKYQESNQYFEKAYIYGEDYQLNYLNEATSFLLNPNVTDYKGEDFEYLLINYYKALNYLKLGQYQEALVECKRMNIKLYKLSDKYSSDNKYKRDAFIHVLMGIIYEANDELNDAFIAYRNAVEIYENDYKRLFGLETPLQLKQDLLKTAYLNGFTSELDFWERKLNMKYVHPSGKTGDVIFFWHSGLGPVKTQGEIDFTIVRGQAGIVSFQNNNFGFNFPFPIEDKDYNESGLSKLEFIRVTYPQYAERSLFFLSAQLKWNGQTFDLEKTEDINAIAFKSLHERMFQELGKSLLRVALKKASEYALRKDDKDAGAILGIFNALSEQADTRGWQSVPHTIYYKRLSLPEGKQEVAFSPQHSFISSGNTAIVQVNPNVNNFSQSGSGTSEVSTATNNSGTLKFTFDVKAGKTIIHTFHSLEISHSVPY